MTKPDLNTDYNIGYRKPPAHSRFKKGRSGNPTGRPKGHLNLMTVLESALKAKVLVTDGGRRVSKSKLEVAITQVANKAASGDLKAVQMVLALMPILEPVIPGTVMTPDLLADREMALKLVKRLTETTPKDPGENHE
jgi:hypothetical protein